MSEKEIKQFRLERDTQGEIKIATNTYYGINTARFKENWLWTGTQTNPYLIKAYLYLKQSYAIAHKKLEKLDSKVAQAIEQACEEMRGGSYNFHFIAESLQATSGITINTNISEVIANRAEEILGGKIGEYKLVKVEEAVNLSQDFDSLFLLATKIAVLQALSQLEPEILNLERLLRRDALTLAKVLKVSATPNMQSTTGQWGKRLNTFTTELEIAIRRIREAKNNLLEGNKTNSETLLSSVNKNKETEVNNLVLQNLNNLTEFKFKEEDLSPDHKEQNEFVISDLGLISTALKDLAIVLSKVANITKMAHTPAIQNQNNSISTQIQIYADSLHMAAYQVISNNFSFTFLAQCEQLESVMLMPLLSHNLLSTIEFLQAIVLGFQRQGLL